MKSLRTTINLSGKLAVQIVFRVSAVLPRVKDSSTNRGTWMVLIILQYHFCYSVLYVAPCICTLRPLKTTASRWSLEEYLSLEA